MFTHLHVHTEYSMLDGLSRIEPLVQKVKELGMHSIAITDHGGMYGAIDFYRAARSAGVRPIIGCEMYVAPRLRTSKTSADKTPYHITVLAENTHGYRNLVKLVTKSHLEGFYYKPRIDRELLQEHNEGLTVLSGCPSGEVPSLISKGRIDDARQAAIWYKELFKNYYLEIMQHGDVPELPTINNGLLELHRSLDIPIVGTNDSHYTNEKDASLQDVLICIHTNTNIEDKKRLRMEEHSYYLKSPAEMESLFEELPEAITNTERIAESCELDLDFSQLRLPEFGLPNNDLSADEYLAELSWNGFKSRIPDPTPEEKDRLTYELNVVRHTQFANYFLVVWDIAQFARKTGILFAVRGSAAASLALYCLEVTDVHPLPYKLVFERFLNVERKEMPDIDMDFEDDRREEVINYVVSKYGKDHVAQIITFGTLGARASIRDVGRALAMPYAEVDRVAKLVPFRPNITIDDALQESPDFAEIYEEQSIRNLINTARSLEGLTRHSSTHAAGVVISKEPLDEVIPLQRPSKGSAESVSMTQYAMEPIAILGLLKMDFLGLANLSILARATEMVAHTRNIRIKLRDIPLDNTLTFALLARGETVGVFQLEGTGMTRYIKELKPSSLSDVAAMIALYRPGPMDHISTFIDAKHGRKEPIYPHSALKEILEETYGVIVYQDQVLLIAQRFAGYSLGEADIVRKAMGKKIPEIMAQEREKFLQGALAEGFTSELANEVFALVEPFAGYAFNKAHSVSYGLISYWTAYFKANFTVEYMVALLNSYIGNSEKVAGAIGECRRLKIPVLPPSVNNSNVDFCIETSSDEKPTIRFGMSAVKNVGVTAVQPIVDARAEEGPFTSIEHFCRIADMNTINRKALESLIKSGAFDEFGDRGALLSVVDRILSIAQSESKLRVSGQTSMFDLFGDSVPVPLANITIPETKTPMNERHIWEVELLGTSMSSNPIPNGFIGLESSDTIVSRSEVNSSMNGKKVVLVGQISSTTERFTKEQKPYVIATLELMDGPIETFVWQDTLETTKGLWETGNLVVINGTVRVRDDRQSISCKNAQAYVLPMEPDLKSNEPVNEHSQIFDSVDSKTIRVTSTEVTEEPGTGKSRNVAGAQHRLRLRLNESNEPSSDQMLLEDVSKLLLDFKGDDEVNLEIISEGRIISMEWSLIRVDACPELESQLQELITESGQAFIEVI